MTSQDDFAVRFAKHKDELEWLFMELYHNREGLEVLEREMAEAYNACSAELKALDKARSADPDWYKRGNMFGMTIKFAFSELDFASVLLRSLPCAAFVVALLIVIYSHVLAFCRTTIIWIWYRMLGIAETNEKIPKARECLIRANSANRSSRNSHGLRKLR